MLRHEWKPKSNLDQVLVNVVPPDQNWLSSKAKRWLQAAAALLGSSGCTLQQLWAGLAESSDPACYETQAAERSHEEPGSGQLALHQIRRAVSNSSYLPPTPPLLLFMDIELTLNCLRELCI